MQRALFFRYCMPETSTMTSTTMTTTGQYVGATESLSKTFVAVMCHLLLRALSLEAFSIEFKACTLALRIGGTIVFQLCRDIFAEDADGANRGPRLDVHKLESLIMLLHQFIGFAQLGAVASEAGSSDQTACLHVYIQDQHVTLVWTVSVLVQEPPRTLDCHWRDMSTTNWVLFGGVSTCSGAICKCPATWLQTWPQCKAQRPKGPNGVKGPS